MAKLKKKIFKLQIKGLDWTVHGMTNQQYTRSHGKDSAAITYLQDREMFFNLSHFNTEFVRHELGHAYVASSGTTSSSLTTDQIEELMCEIIGEHGLEIVQQADRIVNFLLK